MTFTATTSSSFRCQQRCLLLAMMIAVSMTGNVAVAHSKTALRGRSNNNNNKSHDKMNGEPRPSAQQQQQPRDLYGLEYGVEGFESLYGDAEDRPDKFVTNPNSPEDLGYHVDVTANERENGADGDDQDQDQDEDDADIGGFEGIDGVFNNDTVPEEQEYDTKIVGGYRASRHQPGFVMLLKKIGTNSATGNPIWNNAGCGGALISACHVATAAHCNIDNMRGVVTGVYVGAMAPWNRNNNKLYAIRTVKRFINHYAYDRRGNDIAVIELDRCVPTHLLKPMEIADPYFNSLMDYNSNMPQVSLLGFGKTTSSEYGLQRELRRVDVPHINTETCQAYYQDFWRKPTEDQQCAGFPQGGKDACQGDSGGPGVVYPYQGSPTLLSITSWGKGCGLAGKPGVFTDVSMHYMWMKSIVCSRYEAYSATYRTNFMKTCTNAHSPNMNRIGGGNSGTNRNSDNSGSNGDKTTTSACKAKGVSASNKSQCCSEKIKNGVCK